MQARSSKHNVNMGPPGEAVIMKLNPSRADKMKKSMNWNDIVEGSLNIIVSESVVHELLLCEPVFKECGNEILYPDGFQHIPKLRVGYLYYAGVAKANGKQYPVLVRRACNALLDRVELFSNVMLRSFLCIADNDTLSVEIINNISI